MNPTPILIFLFLMVLTWVGAYFAGKAGFMQYDKEILNKEANKVKNSDKELSSLAIVSIILVCISFALLAIAGNIWFWYKTLQLFLNHA